MDAGLLCLIYGGSGSAQLLAGIGQRGKSAAVGQHRAARKVCSFFSIWQLANHNVIGFKIMINI